jgi:ATP-dependent helicase/nuclease subunit B
MAAEQPPGGGWAESRPERVSISVVPTTYGRAASERLHEAVARAKADEPLAPVTVLVPANSVGVSARRLLASGRLGPLTAAGQGVVGVSFLTVYRLAELLGAPRLAADGRRPVSTPIVAAAVRRTLAREPGIFAPVAAHPATEEALVAAHRELADLGDPQLDRLEAQSSRAAEVVRIHRATRRALHDAWYDEQDLMRAACATLAEGSPVVADLGTVVCYLPQRWSSPAAHVVRTLAHVTDVSVIAAFTGSAQADAAVIASLGRAGCNVDDATVAAITPAVASEVVSGSDADDEVRTIVRGLVDAMRDGVPLERMAVLYGTDEPYARLLHEHLDAAGIVHNGASVRTLADSVLGRTLLCLFDLAGSDFTRDDVCALLAAAPLLDGNGRTVPAIEWARVSRKAAVIRGIAEWRARLDGYVASLGDNAWGQRERARAEALRGFVESLAAELDPPSLPRTWAGFATWAHRLVRRFLGNERRRETWPALEAEAARRVEAVLDRLAGLDAVDRGPTLESFRRTFELELRAARDRVGRLGDGVLAAPAAFALGVELDRVWVCGLAEGVFPSVPHDDPLLGDSERAVLDGELRLAHERVDDSERSVLAALASTEGARVATWPRGDLRRSTEHVPSRFLVDTLSLVESRTIASYAQGVATVEFPATEHELGVRSALAGAGWVAALVPVARGRELLVARAGSTFTRFDGNLGGLGEALRPVSPLDSDRPISPTRLEQWARCPHAYFMQSVLHIEPVEVPEEILQLQPIERGAMVHSVLDEFLAAGPRDRARLRALAEAVCADAQARGITGRRLLWDRDRRLLLAELDDFFDADEGWRTARHAETLITEVAFGHGESAQGPVELAWDDGRRILVRGTADRIDRDGDGVLVVIDYKTGKPDSYTSLGPENPVAAGERLQLPIYARAALDAYEGEHVEACYWFVGRGNNLRVGYEVGAAVDEIFMDTVRTIADGIEAGIFVGVPPPPGPSPFVECPYCDPDGLGTADAWRAWERKYNAPDLAIYRSLTDDDESEAL